MPALHSAAISTKLMKVYGGSKINWASFNWSWSTH